MTPIACSERMPAKEKVDVLIFVYGKYWVVAQWFTNLTDNAILPYAETDNGRAWVGGETDRCGDPLGYLPKDVTHWCELPPNPATDASW